MINAVADGVRTSPHFMKAIAHRCCSPPMFTSLDSIKCSSRRNSRDFPTSVLLRPIFCSGCSSVSSIVATVGCRLLECQFFVED